MKRYKTIFILILSSVLLLAGCTDESLKEGGKIPLRISAVIPAIADSLVTRAEAETGSFNVALSTTAGEYASAAKTYTATGSSSSYTFSPAIDNNDFKIALLQTTTPLTIYGQVGDIPYYYSDASTAINRGAVTDLKLTYAYAKVAVRVQKAGKTEAVENYTVSSDVLSLPKKPTVHLMSGIRLKQSRNWLKQPTVHRPRIQIQVRLQTLIVQMRTSVWR